MLAVALARMLRSDLAPASGLCFSYYEACHHHDHGASRIGPPYSTFFAWPGQWRRFSKPVVRHGPPRTFWIAAPRWYRGESIEIYVGEWECNVGRDMVSSWPQ